MTSTVDTDSAAPPAWFTAALAAPVAEQTTMADGIPIAYRAWGEPAARGIVLVHGGAAHSRWWDHVGPLLADGRRVVALDLSGHGDSGRRESYSLDGWAREVLAVAADAGLTVPPTVIGHSMGGLVTLRAAALFGARIEGAVVIDSPIRDMAPEEHAAVEQRAFRSLRVYPSREAALARFRPVPDQPVLSYIADHVAATSIRQVDGGWTWKWDPPIFAREVPQEPLTRLDCRVALFRAEHGMVSAAMSDVMYDRLGRVAPVVEIPVAGHHVMLDQPIALVAALRTLLSDWDHSIPASSPGVSLGTRLRERWPRMQVRYRALIALDAIPSKAKAQEYHNHTHALMIQARCMSKPSYTRCFPAELTWDDQGESLHPGDRAEVTITMVDDEATTFFGSGQRFSLWSGTEVGHGTISRRVYSEYGPC